MRNHFQWHTTYGNSVAIKEINFELVNAIIISYYGKYIYNSRDICFKLTSTLLMNFDFIANKIIMNKCKALIQWLTISA